MTGVLTDEQKAAIKAQVPLQRYATTDEVAAAVTWLAGDGAAYVTGAVIPVDGGLGNGALITSGILDGKRILVAGVTMDSSIGFAVAKVAQEQGATVLISNFGRALGITRRIAKRLPTEPPVLELDVTDEAHLAGLADAVREHVDGLDGVVHSIAFGNPETLLGGKFLQGPWPDVAQAVQVSAYSLKSLTHGLPSAHGARRLRGRADLRRHRRLAGVRLDGRGQGGAGVVLALPGPRPRAGGHPGQPGLARARCRRWPPRRSPGSSDLEDCGATGHRSAGTTPTTSRRRKAICALLSDLFPATTGEIVHVDGGFHAMGA